jgi:trans-aconitate methyltransferase
MASRLTGGEPNSDERRSVSILKSDLDEYRGRQFDLIVADPSLEHVPKVGDTLDAWVKLTARDAALVIFVPNGSCRDARRLGVGGGPVHW